MLLDELGRGQGGGGREEGGLLQGSGLSAAWQAKRTLAHGSPWHSVRCYTVTCV